MDPKILYDLLEKDFLPIVCPIGLDDDYHTYNINADDAACAIATAVNAEKLAFLTDIEGVYRDSEDKIHADLRADRRRGQRACWTADMSGAACCPKLEELHRRH